MRQVLAAVLATGLAFSSAQAGQNASESSRTLQWKMKYVEGAGPQAVRRSCRVTFEGDELICEAKKKVLLSIPLASIYEVASHNNRQRHPLKAGLRTAGAFPSAILSSPSGDPQGDAALLTLYMMYGFVPTFAISSLVHKKRQRYVVAIAWESEFGPEEAVFELSPAAYESFLPALQKVTGKEWLNLAVQKKRLMETRDALAIRLPARTRVAPFHLKPGDYQLVFLESGDGRGNLYFIEGKKVNSRRIAAVAPVEVLPGLGPADLPPLTYGDWEGAATIREVRLAGKKLRLKAAAQEPASSSPESKRPPN